MRREKRSNDLEGYTVATLSKMYSFLRFFIWFDALTLLIAGIVLLIMHNYLIGPILFVLAFVLPLQLIIHKIIFGFLYDIKIIRCRLDKIELDDDNPRSSI